MLNAKEEVKKNKMKSIIIIGYMGAGKTTVSLALAHHLRSWPALVVAPLSAFISLGCVMASV